MCAFIGSSHLYFTAYLASVKLNCDVSARPPVPQVGSLSATPDAQMRFGASTGFSLLNWSASGDQAVHLFGLCST